MFAGTVFGAKAALVAMAATLMLPEAAVPAAPPPTVEYHHTQKLEVLHEFRGQMPVAVALTSTGRRFVSYPRWEDKLTFTLAELKNGREVPWPRGGVYQNGNTRGPRVNLVSLQGILVDARDRLWVLDTGTVNMKPVLPFSPKIICYNTRTKAEEWRFLVPPDVAPPGTYLNDLRVDLKRGPQGTIFITDSGKKPGLIVVDIATKRAVRRLDGHPSVMAEKGFVAFPEGKALFKRPDPKTATHVAIGSDGIALSPDGERLYYTPLASRRLFSVSCDALADSSQTDDQVEATVKDLGEKGVADGMAFDAKGRLYITNWEQNALVRRLSSGLFETVVHDPRLLWPDTLDISRDGYLYAISNQLHRQKGYNAGKDMRRKPYLLVRVKIDAGPVLR